MESYEHVVINTKSEKESSAEEEAAKQQLEKPIIEYNNKTWKSWKDLENKGIVNQIPHQVEAPETRKQRFLSRVDLEKGPIERKVTIMVRFKAKNRGEAQKDYIKYFEDWYGKDWMERALNPVENEEGWYKEQTTEKVVRYDEYKGPQITGSKRSGEHTVYTIPFSKEAVDKAIGDQDRTDIKFKVRTSERGDYFTYDEFVNYSWEQLEDILMMNGGAEAARVERKKQSQGKNVKTANKLDFKPS